MEKVNPENDYFINPEGLKLFRLIYPSTIQPYKAIVFVCHGLFEHCQFAYYDQLIRPLNEIGCMVITHDHQGHGRSEGDRGMIYHFEFLVRDVLLDIDDVIKKYKINDTVPIFLYGHSMGGLISVYAVTQRKNFFKGMCLEAPALIFPSKIGPVTIFCGKILSRLFPTFQLKKTDPNDLCRNLDHVNTMIHDELFINIGVPAKTGIELYYGVNKVKDFFTDVETPFIIGHGDADEICELIGSKNMMETSPIEDKTLIVFPNAKHQLRMEIDNVDIEFRSKIINWINDKIISVN